MTTPYFLPSPSVLQRLELKEALTPKQRSQTPALSSEVNAEIDRLTKENEILNEKLEKVNINMKQAVFNLVREHWPSIEVSYKFLPPKVLQ